MLHKTCPASDEVEHARLIAADDSLSACARQLDRVTQASGEISAVRNRQNHRELCFVMKGIERDDQHRTSAPLFMTESGI